jgi:LacI family transcriptional regulator
MVTIRDIAKKVGFSESIVSRALNNNPQIKESTRELITKAAQEMGYYPNVAARSLVTRRTQTIGVFMASISGMYYSAIIKGMEFMANRAGYTLIFANSYNNAEYSRFLAEERVDGLIIFNSTVKDRGLLLKLVSQEVPFVLVESYLSDPRANCVWVENVQGGYLATKHLIDNGYTRIAFISGDFEFQISLDRFEGYKKALQEAQITFRPEFLTTGNYSSLDGYKAMKNLLEYTPRCNAVFAASDDMAFGAMKAIHEAGLRIPGDIALVGYDDIEFCEYTNPTLSTIRQPRYTMGEKAMSILVSTLKSKQKPVNGKKICLIPELIVRKST